MSSLFVFSQFVGARAGLVGQRQGEDDHVFLVALKGVHRAAGGVLKVLRAQHGLDGGALLRKRRNDAHLLVRVRGQVCSMRRTSCGAVFFSSVVSLGTST